MRMANIADYSSMDKEQQRIYMDSLNNYRTVMAAKEYDFSRGRAEGDRNRQLSTAIALKQMGVLTNQQIAEATGLTIEEIENL